MEIPPQYRGREQAFFMHCLLVAYLERLFMIVGQHLPTCWGTPSGSLETFREFSVNWSKMVR